MPKFSHLLKDGFVVVDVVDANDDLGGAAEREGSAGRIVVRGSNVEDILGPFEPGRWTPPQLDDACTQTSPLQKDAVHKYKSFIR